MEVSLSCLTDDQLQAAAEGRIPRGSTAWEHLETCRACRAIVALAQSATITAPSEVGPSTPLKATTLARGQLIGRYVVLGQLGAGGMGIVYAAYDAELDRRIAIKVLKPSGDPEESGPRRARMLSEAKTMARLTHPNVIRVYDVGEHDESLFIAMELVDGTTLGGWMKEKKRTYREVVAAFAAAGAGLAAAHEAGIVHRDFKPANVLVSADGQVFVTDFGLARAFIPLAQVAPEVQAMATPPAAGAASVSAITLQGVIVGTPGYMAPEVFLGEPATTRSDIFSFGVALYEALYGVLPFSRRSIGDVRAGLLRGTNERERKARVPGWLRKELARALHPIPEERHGSMRELVAALARDRMRKWRRAGTVAAAAAVVATAVGLSAGARGPDAREVCRDAGRAAVEALWNPRVEERLAASFLATGRPAAREAITLVTRALDGWKAGYAEQARELCVATREGTQLPALLARRTACLDRRRHEAGALIELFTRAEAKLVERARAAADSLDELASCADLAALAAPVPLPSAAEQAAVDEARALLGRAVALGIALQETEGLAVGLEALDKAKAIGYRPLIAEARVEVGRLLQLLGRFDEAIEPLQETVWEALAVHDDVLAARASLGIVQVRGTQQGRFEEARRELKLTQALLDRLGGDLRLEVNLHNTIGQMAYREGRFAEAVAAYREALALRRRLDEARPDEGAASVTSADNAIRNNLANALAAMGAYDEALAEHEAVLAARIAVEGPTHPAVANTYNNMGQAYFDRFRYREALAMYDKSLALRKVLLPPDHWLIGMTEANLGIVLGKLGELARARELLVHGLALLEKKIGARHPDVAVVASEIASVELAAGALGEAEAWLGRAFEVLDQSVGREHAQAARTHEVHGAWLLAAGEAQAAAGAFGQAVAISEATRPGALAVLPALAGLGAAELAAGEVDAAVAVLERAFARGHEADPVVDGEVAFALARAEALQGRDGEGAALAALAERRFSEAAAAGKAGLEALARWRAEGDGLSTQR